MLLSSLVSIAYIIYALVTVVPLDPRQVVGCGNP